MARTRTIAPDLYQPFLDRLGEPGSDAGKFERVPQNNASPQ